MLVPALSIRALPTEEDVSLLESESFFVWHSPSSMLNEIPTEKRNQHTQSEENSVRII